ncbi:hypothetical protein Sp245p_32130 (plasmid) [Azospirillum baldaniorum]|uniref:DUF1513 domain-containing protein n=1 Tax=Azospirillum baldaniorum TaxID=1064539 RepID=UPI000D600C3F|nr:DUF1513 domain-containing protein [Azospirillum baldaniorum]AWJ94504.1 hypothetical protein Sp245p_32130 [Azospirillum baldaniorum]TWA71651.1 hypothetical protein FBZ85_12164 [Azospirillum brasilense]
MDATRRGTLFLIGGGLLGGSLLGGGLLSALLGPARAETVGGTLFLNAYATAAASPDYGVAALDGAAEVRFTTPTPGRAHGIVVHPTRAEAVAFARRPGRWFMPLSLADGRPGPVIRAPDDRRFTGHGAFSTDGRLLYVAEDDVPRETGSIGVYDAMDGYRRVGAMPTHGLGPHELLMIADGTVLAVGNGGVITHPDTGRAKLNLDEMDSSITYVEVASGKLLDQVRLPEEHANLGIRHIAALADGGIAFGAQDERPVGMLQPLTGTHRPGGGAVRLFETPDDELSRFEGYIGSVAADKGKVAASSPKGGIIGLWDDATGAWLGSAALPDGCGIAPDGDGFLASSGLGTLRTVGAAPDLPGDGLRLADFRWDNHMTRFAI